VTLSDPLKNYIGHRLSQSMNCNLLDGNAKVDGFYPLYIREQLEVVHLLYALTNSWSSPLADFLSISHMSSPTNTLEFAGRKSFLPLATIGQNPFFADSKAGLAALASPTFDPARTVYLPLEAKASVRPTSAAEAMILDNRTTAHRIDVEANASQPTFLVVAQTFYPRWRAEVNGRTVPIWRANHAFQAIELPAGHSRVTIRYLDHVFILGVLLSTLTLLVTAVAWARCGARGRFGHSPDFPRSNRSET